MELDWLMLGGSNGTLGRIPLCGAVVGLGHERFCLPLGAWSVREWLAYFEPDPALSDPVAWARWLFYVDE